MDLRVICIILLVVGIILYAVVFAGQYVAFMQTGDKKYNFLRYFPYELNQFKLKNKKTYVFFAIELVAALCLIASSLFAAMNFAQKLNVPISAYSMFTTSALTMITFVVLRFVKLTAFKPHLLFATLNVVFNLMTLLLYYLFFSNSQYQYVTSTSVRIVVIILILILVGFEFFLMLNKTSKNWAKMVKMDAELVSRPKFCYMPMLEWGNFLIYIFGFIPLIVVLFF